MLSEVITIALLLGGIYLLVKRIITIEIPFIYIGTVAILSWILGPSGAFTGDVLYHILGGGLMIGAFVITSYSIHYTKLYEFGSASVSGYT